MNYKILKKFNISVLYGEFRTVFRFAIVGVLATIFHLVILWYLMRNVNVNPISANFIAFGVSFVFSFLGHYFWTFDAGVNIINALKKFFLTSAFGFLINIITLSTLLRLELASDLKNAIFSTLLTPFISFLVSRFWIFKK